MRYGLRILDVTLNTSNLAPGTPISKTKCYINSGQYQKFHEVNNLIT